ncbi:alpha/beta hydrolase [Lactobacillus kalixensis]|uniref:Serine aminopeptidase S33 domain-containing protein n=1 Tax=Lactobacillus kalixensis DSM 16043 TaxID=1423763 RepID=A0A0R1UDM7_9LACO|nr:alpha/beta hydrolase [Lactobacillus kalixensis]KRL91513.1 hypothetical protein FC46_GL000062 [Lactobacillus kalixensis DSM 16043]
MSVLVALISLLIIACSNPNTAESKTENSNRASKITSQVWQIKNGKETIYGHIYQPKKTHGKMKVAILSHGFGESEEQMKPYAQNLARRGYFAYAYDFPGGSLSGRSKGRDMTQMSILLKKRTF